MRKNVLFICLFIPAVLFFACSTSREGTNRRSPKIRMVNTDSLTIFKENEVDTMAKIKGGFSALASRIQYPEQARKENAQGTVIVKLIVLKTGEPVNLEIKKSVQKDLDREALKDVNQLSFAPGIKDGKAVNSYRTIEISFGLQGFQ